MTNPIWVEARQRARAETLDLLRLNDPWKAGQVLGVPVFAGAASWWITGQFAPAFAISLAVLAIYGLLVFGLKTFLAPAKLVQESRDRYERAEEGWRQMLADAEGRIRELEQALHTPPSSSAAIYQDGLETSQVVGTPEILADIVVFPLLHGRKLDPSKVFLFMDFVLLWLSADSVAGMDSSGRQNVIRGLRARKVGRMSDLMGRGPASRP